MTRIGDERESCYKSEVTRALLLAILLSACGARAGLPVEGERDASTDTPTDARTPDAPSFPDTAFPDVPRPPSCIAEPGFGSFVGMVPGFEIDFPFVVGGIESFGSHSCPRLFIRAGDSPTFDGAFLEIEVHYSRDEGFVPGMREASLTVYPEGRRTAEPWFEEIVVVVESAGGLDGSGLPPDAWRAVAFVDHHDATTDLIGTVDEAPYCNDFAICI